MLINNSNVGIRITRPLLRGIDINNKAAITGSFIIYCKSSFLSQEGNISLLYKLLAGA